MTVIRSVLNAVCSLLGMKKIHVIGVVALGLLVWLLWPSRNGFVEVVGNEPDQLPVSQEAVVPVVVTPPVGLSDSRVRSFSSHQPFDPSTNESSEDKEDVGSGSFIFSFTDENVLLTIPDELAQANVVPVIRLTITTNQTVSISVQLPQNLGGDAASEFVVFREPAMVDGVLREEKIQVFYVDEGSTGTLFGIEPGTWYITSVFDKGYGKSEAAPEELVDLANDFFSR